MRTFICVGNLSRLDSPTVLQESWGFMLSINCCVLTLILIAPLAIAISR